MTQAIINSQYIKRILELHEQNPDRKLFHAAVGPILANMANDKAFMGEVIKRNFDDTGFLNQIWSGYNIPFFYIFENDFINIKIHLFPPHPEKLEHIAAHCIHHHNNYMLTTYAFFGQGYETILFEKDLNVDQESGEAKLKMRDNFKQSEKNPHLIDAWEPHVVFIPQDLSATLIMWTPDKVRLTDNLRNNPILKAAKRPLRKLIHTLGFAHKFGISSSVVHQFYVEDAKFKIIEEEKYFSKTKADKGTLVNEYSAKMIFAFIQRSGLFKEDYFRPKLSQKAFPEYYKTQIQAILGGVEIGDVYHRTEINIPNKSYTKQDIIKASS